MSESTMPLWPWNQSAFTGRMFPQQGVPGLIQDLFCLCVSRRRYLVLSRVWVSVLIKNPPNKELNPAPIKTPNDAHAEMSAAFFFEP